MREIDYDKIQDTLEYIKSVCETAKENGGCVQCPLGNRTGTCQLEVKPVEWQPRHPQTDTFRVLA